MKSRPKNSKSPPARRRPSPPAEEKAKFSVVVGDENALCRRGVRDLLREDDRFDVVAESDDGHAMLRLILEHKPDIAVLDATLPGLTVLEAPALLKARGSQTDLVILTQQKDERIFNQAISLGIRGYVLKKHAANELLACIAAVAQGEAYVSPFLTDLLLRRRSRVESLSRRQPGLTQLTPAEKRILKRIAEGKTSREIAAECGISPRTVDSHRANICEKLGLTGSNRLLQFAFEHRDALSQLA